MFINWKWLLFMHLEQTLIVSLKKPQPQPKSPQKTQVHSRI